MNPKNQNSNFEYPSKSQLNILLEHYQNGRFEDAEKVAKNLTQKYPKDIFAWKVLSAIFWQTGRKSQGIEISIKTILNYAYKLLSYHSNDTIISKCIAAATS